MQTIPRPEYPRPDFKRSEWLNLNGMWAFEFDDLDEGEKQSWQGIKVFTRTILVPYCYQSELSGVEDKTPHDIVWYKRDFTVSEQFLDKRLMLKFGAVDYHAKVWVNGLLAGEHSGGYTPFCFDITSLIKSGKNTITVRAADPLTDTSVPRGKQSWQEENFGCWYTPVTGIWQTVWLEAVSEVHLDKVKITPDFDAECIKLNVFINGAVEGCELKIIISLNQRVVTETTVMVTRKEFSFGLDLKNDRLAWKIATWSPESPTLYDIKFSLMRGGETVDVVESYFGMRKVSTKNGMVLLNNRPIFQRLVLDQGYFNGGLLTAESDEDYVRDIELIKSFGFNGVRKHQKAEDPRFLYWADKLGLLVWGEMGSPYEFNDRMMTANMDEWRRIVERDYNHPSIITWTLMNESWGIPQVLTDKKQQHHTMGLYYMVKSYDETRLVISNDGWEHTVSDILTFHDYTQDGEILANKMRSKERILTEPVCSIGNTLGSKYLFAEDFGYQGQPILLSECCGVAFDNGNGWGYGSNVRTEEEFLDRYRTIMKAIYETPYIAGFCTTQLTDVQQEINGLATVNRKPKIDPEIFARIICNAEVI